MGTKIVHTMFYVIVLGLLLPLDARADDEETLTKRYVNCDYGYAVRVPDGLTGSVPPYQAHGFTIELPEGLGTITVYNSYNMYETTVLPEIAREELRFD